MHDTPIILSASRMTDLPAYYPDALMNEVNVRINKGLKIHTLVLWTKHIQSFFKEPLNSYLKKIKKDHTQLFVHLTVTGMAQKIVGKDKNNKPVIIEPNVPLTDDTIQHLPQLIELTGNPERIRIRIDPLISIVDSWGNTFNNYQQLSEIVSRIKNSGIKNFIFSFLENNMHKKVNQRFSEKGIQIISPGTDERNAFKQYIKDVENTNKVNISACCVSGFNNSRCIDGYTLEILHDLRLPTLKKEPQTRKLCGCTHSIDIGGWPPKICPSGCLYCYSRPYLGKN